jgi:hypothetical protein
LLVMTVSWFGMSAHHRAAERDDAREMDAESGSGSL